MAGASQDRIKRYLQGATRRLWGRQRAALREELHAHIEERVAAHMLAGVGEAEAVERTLAELGESSEIDEGMTRLHAVPGVLSMAMRVALRQFRDRKVESSLIVLAVALGVGVVIAVAAFLDIDAQISRLTRSTLDWRELSVQALEHTANPFTDPDAPQVARVGGPESVAPAFSPDDLETMKEAAPSVSYAYARGPDSVSLVGGDFRDSLIVFAVTEDFLAAANPVVTRGSFFTASDIAEGRQVVVLTEEGVRRLGLSGDPVGQTLWRNSQIRKVDQTIVGVIEAAVGEIQVSGYVPFTEGANLSFLYFAVDDPRRVAAARAELADYVAARWDGRVTVTTHPGLRAADRAQRLTALAIALFASVGLLVASLNIMNLMLARVLRRSKLIGIRRSLGASSSIIRREFLIEGVLLGALGGLLGVGFGYGLQWAYNTVLAAAGDIPARIFSLSLSPTSLAAGLLLAVVASMLFCLYPAFVASRLPIVEALREGR